MDKSSALREAAVVVTSDSCYQDPTKDLSGTYVTQALKNTNIFKEVKKYIIQDERELIARLLQELMKKKKELNLIITIGGTGLCPRDVTPEATSSLYDKPCPGISTALMFESLKKSPHAALSRLTAGISGNCLVVNFPGKLKACEECLSVITGILPHALEQIVFNKQTYDETHKKQMAATLSSSETITRIDPSHAGDQVVGIECESDVPRAQKRRHPDSDHTSIYSANELPCSDSKLLAGLKKIESPYPMVSYEIAIQKIQQMAPALRTCLMTDNNSLVNEYDLIGSVLMEDVASTAILPPYKVSTMDGYVLNMSKRTSNLMKSIGYINARVVANIQEFRRLQALNEASSSFFCYQVNTGGPVPEDNYVIVPFECTAGSTDQEKVTILKVPTNANYVRQPGSDLDHDYKLPKGTRIGPAEYALLISMRPKQFEIVRKPKIGLLATGDELVSAHARHIPLDKVIDTNTPLLRAYFKLKGYSVVEFGISKDKPEELLGKILDSLEHCDILLISGGASMGTRDHVKNSLLELGLKILFGRVSMKPGKPVAFATSENKRQFVFSLPGNPASAYVTTVTIVIPLIEMAMSDATQLGPIGCSGNIGTFIRVRIIYISDLEQGQVYSLEAERQEFIRAKIVEENNSDGSFNVRISAKQQSSRLANLHGCNCLVIVEPFKGEGNSFRKLECGPIYKALRV